MHLAPELRLICSSTEQTSSIQKPLCLPFPEKSLWHRLSVWITEDTNSTTRFSGVDMAGTRWGSRHALQKVQDHCRQVSWHPTADSLPTWHPARPSTGCLKPWAVFRGRMMALGAYPDAEVATGRQRLHLRRTTQLHGMHLYRAHHGICIHGPQSCIPASPQLACASTKP